MAERRRLGAWYTPPTLVAQVADMAVATAASPATNSAPAVTVLDPACGDGRLLVATAERLRAAGHTVRTVGVDVDSTLAHPEGVDEFLCGDALTLDWSGVLPDGCADVVVGNPPFRSPLPRGHNTPAAPTMGVGPYGDLALAFIDLSMTLVRPGGRVVLVLPTSVLASRDAGRVRRRAEQRGVLDTWWWHPDRVFDAHVDVCVLGFTAGSAPRTVPGAPVWSHVVTSSVGVPDLGTFTVDGTVGDRCRVSANFRDEYYALVDAVVPSSGAAPTRERPALVTSGVIDPWQCHWGERPVRFAGQRVQAPVVDRSRLSGRFVAWAERLLVPKVLVAAQTRTVEAVADVDGVWLPGVPVVSVIPSSTPTVDVRHVAAVLTSSVATVWAWHQRAGTGLSATSFRLSPATVADMPWPAGDLTAAVQACEAGDIEAGRRAADAAFGVDARTSDIFAVFMASLATRRRT